MSTIARPTAVGLEPGRMVPDDPEIHLWLARRLIAVERTRRGLLGRIRRLISKKTLGHRPRIDM